MSGPAVTVILPVRHGMPYLPRALDSILQQTWRDFECLVVDDHPAALSAAPPADGTVDGAHDRADDGTAAYLATVADDRVRVLRTGGAGLAAALNLGLAAARAPLIARQDADDWSHPGRLASQLALLRQQPEIDVLATAVDFVDADDRPVANDWTERIRSQWDAAVTPGDIAALMPLTCCLFHATVVARTSALRRAGGYDPRTVPAEDYDLWLRMLPAARFARLAQRLYTVRVHAASSSSVGRTAQMQQVIAAKLRFIRRQAPWLGTAATLALPYADRGAAIFRQVAPACGFTVLAGEAAAASGADLVAITPFDELTRWAAPLMAAGGYRQFGNLFVRLPDGGVQPRGTDLETEPLADHP